MLGDDLAKSMQHSINNKFGAGEYQVLEPLKRGGDGYVYKARIRKTNQCVALKALPKNQINFNLTSEKSQKKYNTCADLTKKAKNQIKIHEVLKSHFIVKLLQWFEDQFNFYLMLEYFPEGDLSQLMKIHPDGLSVQSVRNIGSQIAKGISMIHKSGVIHRDIKPNNILVTKSLEIRICDFSCSTKINNQEKIKGVVGTLQYMAPQILKNYDLKIDIWSFGCLLYYLAKGHAPFKMQKNELSNLIKSINSDKINQLQFPTVFPASFKDLLRKILKIKPQERMSIQQIINHPFLIGKDELIPQILPQRDLLKIKQNPRISQSMQNLKVSLKNNNTLQKTQSNNRSYNKNKVSNPDLRKNNITQLESENIDPNIQKNSELQSKLKLKVCLKNEDLLNRKLGSKQTMINSVSEKLDKKQKKQHRKLSPLNCQGVIYQSTQGEDDQQQIIIDENGFQKKYLKTGKIFQISPRGNQISLSTGEMCVKNYTLEDLPEKHFHLYQKFKQVVQDIRRARIQNQSRKKLLKMEQFSQTDKKSVIEKKQDNLSPNIQTTFQVNIGPLTMTIDCRIFFQDSKKSHSQTQIKENISKKILKSFKNNGIYKDIEIYQFLQEYFNKKEIRLRSKYYDEYFQAVEKTLKSIKILMDQPANRSQKQDENIRFGRNRMKQLKV